MLTILTSVVVLLAILALGIFLLGVLGFLLAQVDILFTTVKTGEMKFVIRGETRHRVLLNVPGYYFDDKTGKIVLKPPKGYGDDRSLIARLLERLFGIWWLGFPPFYSLKSFHLDGESWVKDEKFKTKKYDSEERLYSLQVSHIYALLATEVELGDNFLVDIAADVTLRVINPDRAIFALGGTYLYSVLQALRGGINDYANNKKYDEFRVEDKSLPTSEFAKALMSLNSSLGLGQPGLEEAYGISIEKVAFGEQRLSPTQEQERVQAAVHAAAIALQEGEGRVNKAKKDAEAAEHAAKAIKRVGLAQSAVERSRHKSTGGSNEVMVAEQQREAAAALATFHGQTLVTGSGTGVMVNTPTTPPRPPAAPASPAGGIT
jgi:regulator of protease activity HflC (stomatin/prohibitin superfamily)